MPELTPTSPMTLACCSRRQATGFLCRRSIATYSLVIGGLGSAASAR